MGCKTYTPVIEDGKLYAKLVRDSLKLDKPYFEPLTNIQLRLMLHIITKFC